MPLQIEILYNILIKMFSIYVYSTFLYSVLNLFNINTCYFLYELVVSIFIYYFYYFILLLFYFYIVFIIITCFNIIVIIKWI